MSDSGRPHRRFLVFVCGHAGTGKSTLARRLVGALHGRTGAPFCLLDKDTVYGAYSAAALRLATGDANDRDSPLFLDHLRDPEYRSLVDTAVSNLAVGVSAVVVAPLSREVRERRLFDRQWLHVDDDVTIRVLWIHVDDDVARERIVARGDPADAYKLAHWNAYRQRRFVPAPDVAADLLMINGDAALDDDALDAIVTRIVPD